MQKIYRNRTGHSREATAEKQATADRTANFEKRRQDRALPEENIFLEGFLNLDHGRQSEDLA
jgi:hypothetical protein